MTPTQQIEAAAEKAATEECRRIYPDLCTGLSDDHVLFLRYRDELKPAFVRFAAQLMLTGAMKGVSEKIAAHITDLRKTAKVVRKYRFAATAEEMERSADELQQALASISAIKGLGEGKP